MRILSLLPEASEILSAIGAGPMLVGQLDPNPSQQCLQAELNRLGVDLILAGPDPIQRSDELPLCRLNRSTIEDLFDNMLRIGQAVGLEREAIEHVVQLRGRLHSAMDLVNPYLDGPAVALLDGLDPLRIAGLWNVQLIERAGGRCPWNPTTAPSDAGAAAGPQVAYRSAGTPKVISPVELAAESPDFLVLAPRGLNLDQTRQAALEIARQEWFQRLPAVRAGNVALIDGSRMFNTLSPILIEAFEFLVGWINDRPEIIPDDFPWARFQLETNAE